MIPNTVAVVSVICQPTTVVHGHVKAPDGGDNTANKKEEEKNRL